MYSELHFSIAKYCTHTNRTIIKTFNVDSIVTAKTFMASTRNKHIHKTEYDMPFSITFHSLPHFIWNVHWTESIQSNVGSVDAKGIVHNG